MVGWVLLDRSGKHFGTVLNYLRDGTVPLPESRQELEELMVETQFYCLEGLRRTCEEKLEKLIADTKEEGPHVATILIVKYPEIAKAIFASTNKVTNCHAPKIKPLSNYNANNSIICLEFFYIELNVFFCKWRLPNSGHFHRPVNIQ